MRFTVFKQLVPEPVRGTKPTEYAARFLRVGHVDADSGAAAIAEARKWQIFAREPKCWLSAFPVVELLH